MKWSWFGRAALALTSVVSLGLSMTACGGGTVAYIWAVGNTASGSGQVVAYKVDNYTGNLTAVPNQPFSSNGSNPVLIVVRPGGRFVYVINEGTGASGSSAGTAEGIDEFSVGGEGTLTFQNHYDTNGRDHVWATFDSTGGFLYVLDKYSPAYQPDPTKANYDVNGAIATFSSDATTGRLQLQNQANFTLPGQPAPLYVEVGQTPRRLFSTGGCLFTLNDVGQTVTPYSIATGQLGTVTTGTFPVNSISATSIAGNASNVFITDTLNSTSGQVFNYTVSNCALVPFVASPVTTNATVTNAALSNPSNAFISSSGKYIYVLNANNQSTQVNAQGSTVSAFVPNAGSLQTLSGSPFPVGAGPVCMVEDPTSKFVYTSNQTDGTITGLIYSDTTGQLAPLSRGSRFQTSVQKLGCLAISSVV